MPELTVKSTPSGVEEGATEESTQAVNSTASNSNTENGVSSTSPVKTSSDKSEAETLLAQGKRHLYVKDFPNAVATLGDACAKLSEMFGDMANECGDAYFSYGRALLELAREESTGLDPNALGTESEKEDSEDGGDDGGDKSDENEKIESDNHEENDEKSPVDETINTTNNENDEDGEKEENDEVDNLQLAWEVLELAKNIYERQNQDAKLAETYLYLGEVALESESYVNAVEDMKHCVEIQKRIKAPDREIAETYFQLGIACSLSNEFDEAIVNFKSSSEVLEKRIKYLEDGSAPQENAETNPFYSTEKEISEIKELLPEIKAKIADMEDSKQNTIKSVMAAVKDKFSDGAGPSSSSSAPVANGTTPKPATNISHLVRKKRKPEEEEPSSEITVKKTCTSEAKK